MSEVSANTIEGLTGLLSKATPDQKRLLQQALEVGSTIKTRRPQQTNQDARRMSSSGFSIDMGPDFVPKPSEALVEKMGKEAAQAHVAARYHAAQGGGATKSITAREVAEYGVESLDADSLAESAQMEFATDGVEPLPSSDIIDAEFVASE